MMFIEMECVLFDILWSNQVMIVINILYYITNFKFPYNINSFICGVCQYLSRR